MVVLSEPLIWVEVKHLSPELNPICYILALLVHHFLHVSRIGVKSLTLRLLMSYIYDISNLRVNLDGITNKMVPR
jgi:transposase